MEIVHVGIGGNIGDVEKNISEAIKKIALLPGTKVAKVSSLYKTKPVGFKNQPFFINGALELETNQDPQAFLNALHEIEFNLGRNRSIKWGPRTIDLDILLFGEKIFDSPNFHVPHPRMHERAFVLIPLNEIAPTAIHVVFGKSIHRLLSEINAPHGVELWKNSLCADTDMVVSAK